MTVYVSLSFTTNMELEFLNVESSIETRCGLMARASFLLTHRAYCEWERVESEREGEGGAGEEGEDKGTKRVGRREEKGKRC